MYQRHLVSMENPPAIRLRSGRKDNIELLESFDFVDESMWITCPAGYYDGFSIPWIARVLSGDRLNKSMAGVEASMVHDTACEKGLVSRKYRRQLFWRALKQSNLQLHEGNLKRIDTLGAGVHIASKYFSVC